MNTVNRHRLIPFAIARYALVLLIWLCALGSAVAQPNQEQLRSKIDALDANQQLDAALKTRLLEQYKSALANLQAADSAQTQAKDYAQALKTLPAQLKSVKKNLERANAALKAPSPANFDDIPTEELEQRLVIERNRLNDLNNQTKKLESELGTQSLRMPQIRQSLVDLQEKLDGLAPVNGGAQNLESEAHEMLTHSLREAYLAEQKKLVAEALVNPSQIELLKLQIELSSAQAQALQPGIDQLEGDLAARRQQEADKWQQELSQAEKELAGKHPLLQQLIRDNIAYSRELAALGESISTVQADLEKATTTNNQIDKDFKSAEQKIELAGLSPALGRILRQQRRDLPSARQLASESQTLQNQAATASYGQFKTEERLQQLADINALLKSAIGGQVGGEVSAIERMQIQAELRILLTGQKELLLKLLPAYTSYLRLIGDLEFARQQTEKLADKYAQFLDKRLLWVPSSPPLDSRFIPDLYHAGLWLLTPKHWGQSLQEIAKALRQHPLLGVLAPFALLGLYALKRRAKAHLALVAQKVAKPYSDKFVYTVEALACCLVLVAPLPLALQFIGWLLVQDLGVSEFSHALGEGLLAAAVPLLALQYMYLFSHPLGIAALHLRWQDSTRKTLRRLCAWLRFIVVPSVFLFTMTGAQSQAVHSDSLGRLALLVVLGALTWVFYRLLKFQGGILETHLACNPKSYVTRSRYFWFPAIVAAPVVVGGFALAGYYASALELEHKLVITVRLVVALVIVYDLLLRWLALFNRQLAIVKARQRRDAAQANKSGSEGGEEQPASIDSIDIPTINAQTRRMLKALISFCLVLSLWVVWRDILPALAVLDDIVLWQHDVQVDGVTSLRPITLTNLLLAGLYGAIVLVGLRNLPGLLEIVLLKQLAVEPGNRYAINQLARYVLAAVGVIAVSHELGGSWEKIQWLVAALGVGLGFGLQEIFANLVSGIILLFERPMRVGDTVTIGDLSGKVSRIQMRATTIVDWDQKELIVPNKTFITGQLVNWTLSDQVTRVVIPVGVAFGVDPDVVHQIIAETLRATPRILAEPEPSVYFVGFGDTGLNFTVRVFVKELSDRMPVTHDLHMRLAQAFREHHIALASSLPHFIDRAPASAVPSTLATGK